jgi:hypothetical protein
VEADYRPKWRYQWFSLPGFASGWFKLQNKEKALVFLTDRSRVVYIPTSENYSVLLSVGKPRNWPMPPKLVIRKSGKQMPYTIHQAQELLKNKKLSSVELTQAVSIASPGSSRRRGLW